MQKFEIDNSSLIVNKNEKDEKSKKKISFKIFGIVFLICLSIILIFIYINNTKLLEEEKEKNDELKHIVDDLIAERNRTRKKINDLIQWKENNEKNKEEAHSEHEVDSLIFNSQDIHLISDRLTNKEELKDRNVIFNLIYRASRDGADANSYHKMCDGKSNTVSVVQTVKGNKFGGYTEIQIESGSMGYKDPNSFVFSLNKQKIYENLNKNGLVIRHYRDYGPYFVGGFITFDSQFYSNNNNYVYDRSSSSNFFPKNEKEYEINNGEQFYAIRELEVFEIFLE